MREKIELHLKKKRKTFQMETAEMLSKKTI